MPDYIPRTDAEFTTWVNNFATALQARQERLQILDTDFDALTLHTTRWGAASAAHNNAQQAAATATSLKQQEREAFEGLVRGLVRRVQSHPALLDSDRVALGITVPASGRSRAPVPTTRPTAEIDTSQRLRHTIHFIDEMTPGTRAKPAGVRGCEIYGKVSATPINDPSQLNFLALDTSSPYVIEYTAADAGKTAYYMLRWVNSRDEKGPWSQTVSATITA